jgi:hypothetical protein
LAAFPSHEKAQFATKKSRVGDILGLELLDRGTLWATEPACANVLCPDLRSGDHEPNRDASLAHAAADGGGLAAKATSWNA